MEFENFLHSVLLKSICLSCILNGSSAHAGFCNIVHTGHFKNIRTLSYVAFLKADTYHFTIWKNKTHSLISPPILLENVLKCREAVSSLWLTHVLQHRNFHLKAHICSLVINTVSCFSWSDGLILFILKTVTVKSSEQPWFVSHSLK